DAERQGGQSLDVATARRARHGEGDGVDCSVHRRQEGVAQAAGCHVRQRVAGAPALPGVRGGGARQTGVHRPVEEAGRRPGGGRGAAQFPGPPTPAVGLVFVARATPLGRRFGKLRWCANPPLAPVTRLPYWSEFQFLPRNAPFTMAKITGTPRCFCSTSRKETTFAKACNSREVICVSSSASPRTALSTSSLLLPAAMASAIANRLLFIWSWIGVASFCASSSAVLTSFFWSLLSLSVSVRRSSRVPPPKAILGAMSPPPPRPPPPPPRWANTSVDARSPANRIRLSTYCLHSPLPWPPLPRPAPPPGMPPPANIPAISSNACGALDCWLGLSSAYSLPKASASMPVIVALTLVYSPKSFLRSSALALPVMALAISTRPLVS